MGLAAAEPAAIVRVHAAIVAETASDVARETLATEGTSAGSQEREADGRRRRGAQM
jgi:hypothetical protein